MLDLAEKLFSGIGNNLFIHLVTLVLISSAYLTFLRGYTIVVSMRMILENNRICNDLSMHVIGSVLSA